jgi:hypothetical protein
MSDSCKQPKWTKADVNEFDRLVTKMDSRNQMQRIKGRLDWSAFRDRFTKEELDEMWELIKDK